MFIIVAFYRMDTSRAECVVQWLNTYDLLCITISNLSLHLLPTWTSGLFNYTHSMYLPSYNLCAQIGFFLNAGRFMEAGKLLHKDYADISKVCNPDFAKVGVEDMFNWKVWILGPPEYPYQGAGFIHLLSVFPRSLPSQSSQDQVPNQGIIYLHLCLLIITTR